MPEESLRRAVYDPGSVVGARRGPSWGVGHEAYAVDQESVWDWVTRAVVSVAAADVDRRVVHAEQTARLATANLATADGLLADARAERDGLRQLLHDALRTVHSPHKPIPVYGCQAHLCKRIREAVGDA